MAIKRTPIKELPKTFTKGEKTFNRVFFSENAYMYEVVDTHIDHVYYEVFRRKTQFGYDFETKQKTDELVVRYPTNEAFGYWAWCVSRGVDLLAAFEEAKTIYENLNKTDETII